MNGSIRDWDKLVRQAYQHLAPGGYLEMCETVSPVRSDDRSLPEDSALYKWSMLLHEGAAKFGSPLDAAEKHKQRMIDAGFQNVVQVEGKWPTNEWPRDAKYKEVGKRNHVIQIPFNERSNFWIGLWSYESIIEGLQPATMMLFTQALGWSTEQVEVFLVDVRKDLKNRKIHGYYPV